MTVRRRGPERRRRLLAIAANVDPGRKRASQRTLLAPPAAGPGATSLGCRPACAIAGDRSARRGAERRHLSGAHAHPLHAHGALKTEATRGRLNLAAYAVI